MPRTLLLLSLSFLGWIAPVCAEDAPAPGTDKTLEHVAAFVGDHFSGGARTLPFTLTMFGSLRKVEIAGADARALKVRLGKDSFDLAWSGLEAEEIGKIARECVGDDPRRTALLIQYGRATGQKALADEMSARLTHLCEALAVAPEQFLATLNRIINPPDAPNASLAEGAAAEQSAAPPRMALRPSAPGALTPAAEVSAALDNAIEIHLSELRIKPEAVCDDATFLRRASLDLTGHIPSAAEAIAFMKEKAPDKRTRKIAELLKRPEYADHWATYWSNTLVGAPPQQMNVFFFNPAPLRQWLRREFAQNKPLDSLARELLTAQATSPQGYSIPTNPTPALYLAHHLAAKGLPQTADHITRTFLGTRVGCAQCHDHPFDKWTQRDFWGLAASLSYTRGFFNGIQDESARISGGSYDPPSKDLLLSPLLLDEYVAADGADEPGAPRIARRTPASTARSAAARASLGKNRGAVYRRELAEWVTDLNQENFDRSAVNRMWRALFGQGLVEPVDDLRPANAPSHPRVLEILAADFRDSGRDLKRLLAILAGMRAYQRGSAGAAVKAARHQAVRYAARAEIRPMTPEMLFMAILRATGGDERAERAVKALRAADERPAGYSAESAEILDLMRRFLVSATPDGDGGDLFSGSFQQALLMMHSELITRTVRESITRQANRGVRDMQHIFAATVSRPPTPVEIIAFEKFSEGLEGVLWVLLNSAEFVTIP